MAWHRIPRRNHQETTEVSCVHHMRPRNANDLERAIAFKGHLNTDLCTQGHGASKSTTILP